jgi:hypothetical protein
MALRPTSPPPEVPGFIVFMAFGGVDHAPIDARESNVGQREEIRIEGVRIDIQPDRVVNGKLASILADLVIASLSDLKRNQYLTLY